MYLWWELAQVSFLSRQNMSQQIFVHNKTFVTTNICAWRKLSQQIFLVTNTWHLWQWQKCAWPYVTHDIIQRFVRVRCFRCGCSWCEVGEERCSETGLTGGWSLIRENTICMLFIWAMAVKKILCAEAVMFPVSLHCCLWQDHKMLFFMTVMFTKCCSS